jgi:hypothetical protein
VPAGDGSAYVYGAGIFAFADPGEGVVYVYENVGLYGAAAKDAAAYLFEVVTFAPAGEWHVGWLILRPDPREAIAYVYERSGGGRLLGDLWVNGVVTDPPAVLNSGGEGFGPVYLGPADLDTSSLVFKVDGVAQPVAPPGVVTFTGAGVVLITWLDTAHTTFRIGEPLQATVDGGPGWMLVFMWPELSNGTGAGTTGSGSRPGPCGPSGTTSGCARTTRGS